MLGYLDSDTREWHDGLLTMASRQVLADDTETKHWIVCDGDIDPDWIEALNSVLDDNRLLTMPNGERIQFGKNVNFIFETHDLQFASPATISRMGVLFFPSPTFTDQEFLNCHLDIMEKSKLSNFLKEITLPLVEAVTSPGFAGTSPVCAVSLLKILPKVDLNVMDEESWPLQILQTVTSHMDCTTKMRFLEHISQTKALQPLKKLAQLLMNPAKGILKSDINRGELANYPAADTIIKVIKYAISSGTNAILVGLPSCGKSTLVHLSLVDQDVSLVTVHCNATTTEISVVDQISSFCLVTSSQYGLQMRSKSRKLVVMLKNVDSAQSDQYKSSRLVSWLIQILSHGGFYNEHLEYVQMLNIVFICTASLEASSLLQLHSRLSTRLQVIFVRKNTTETIETIAGALIKRKLGHFKLDDSDELADGLTLSIVRTYQEACEKFTSSQSPHYRFNLGHVVRWIHGIFVQSFSGVKESDVPAYIYRASMHAAQKTLGDMLTSAEERTTLMTILFNGFREHRAICFLDSVTIATFLAVKDGMLQEVSGSVFSRQITEWNDEYSMRKASIELNLSDESFGYLRLLSSLIFSLYVSGTCFMMIGKCGMQRHSAVDFVASAMRMKSCQIIPTPNYSIQDFLGDLKSIYATAVVSNEPCVLILDDASLEITFCWPIISALLNSGYVTGLLSKSECELVTAAHSSTTGISSSVSIAAGERGQRNLRIVLITDVENFHPLYKSNPILLRRASMFWVETRVGVLEKIALFHCNVLKISDAQSVVERSTSIHNFCIQKLPMITPQHFRSFMETFAAIYGKKKTTVTHESNRFKLGVSKLRETAATVATLKEKASKQAIEITLKQKEADLALNDITKNMALAGQQKQECEVLTVNLSKEETELKAQKSSVEAELRDVEPLLSAARESVGQIRSDHLSEIRSLRAPPTIIRDVLEAVLRLMGVFDVSWNSMKTFLGKRTVKEEIVNFDARTITADVRKSVVQLMREKPASFDDVNVKRSSVAVAPLAVWIKANLAYCDVLERIAPLEKKLIILTSSLASSSAKVQLLQGEVKSLELSFVDLRQTFARKTAEGETLKVKQQELQNSIQSAELLLTRLSDEDVRWSSNYSRLEQECKGLEMESLFAAAIVTYISHLPEQQRSNLADLFSTILAVSRSFTQIMVSAADSTRLRDEGLSVNRGVIEAATMVVSTTCTPMLLDPTGQCLRWLISRVSNLPNDVVSIRDSNIMKSLELAMRFGKALIIQNVERIPAYLIPLIRNDFTIVGTRHLLPLGNRLVDCDAKFRLFLCAANINFVVPSYLSGLVCLVNSSLSPEAVAEQFLTAAVDNDYPDLEIKKNSLMSKQLVMMKELVAKEDSILSDLTALQGNILDNQALMNSLAELKSRCVEVALDLQTTEALKNAIDKERENFRAYGQRAATLFTTLVSLGRVNDLYQMDLAVLQRLSRQVLRHDAKNSNRCADIVKRLTLTTLEQVKLALFEKDRPLFAFLLALNVYPDHSSAYIWDHFIALWQGAGGNNSSIPSWIQGEKNHQNFRDAIVCAFLIYYSNVQGINTNLVTQLQLDKSNIWSSWLWNRDAKFPGNRSYSLSEQALIIYALCPEVLAEFGMNVFVGFLISVTWQTSAIFDTSNVVQYDYKKDIIDSNSADVFLFVAGPGTDPSKEIVQIAQETLGADSFREIAMGQGQLENADQMLKQCQAEGKWLIMKNVHLARGWLSTLTEKLSSSSHVEFRLFLTCLPDRALPPSLVRKSIKIVVEPEPGVMCNMMRTHAMWDDTMIDKSPTYGQMMLLLSWFHAICQERRNYVPFGWSKFYDFSTEDFVYATRIALVTS